MVMGVHIEVIYANVGSLANPQAKILGLRYNYAESRTLKYKVSLNVGVLFGGCHRNADLKAKL